MKSWPKWLAAGILAASVLSGCESGSGMNSDHANNGKEAENAAGGAPAPSKAPAASPAASPAAAAVDEQPSTVWYEIFVRSFYDSDGDGIGDLNGVTEKLDYVKELGVEGIWLMPINPSPSYHGYDVTDYRAVNKDYGTMDDMKRLLAEAHKRGIKVIMDLVANHSSTDHPWFIDSAKGKSSKYRDWYTWAEDQGIEKPAAVSATNGQAWHEKNGSHYLGVFWEGMPDLNYDNPDVRAEMVSIADFWLGAGVDGFRIDAAKHIYDDFNTSKSDPQTAAKNKKWWQEFRTGIMEKHPDAYLISEVWDGPGTIAPYLDHAFNSSFNFNLNDSIRSAVAAERAPDIAGSLDRVYKAFEKSSDGSFVDGLFIGNHDFDRLASAAGSPDHARMAAQIELTLPGNPFVYYGDELGMKGAGRDEFKRLPMRWHSAGSGKGQTTWQKDLANPASSGVTVEEQEKDPSSLLSLYKMLIQWRAVEPALRDGGIAPSTVKGDGIEAYERLTAKERVLVVHNLKGAVRKVQLDEATAAAYGAVAHGTSPESRLSGGVLEMAPYSTVVLK